MDTAGKLTEMHAQKIGYANSAAKWIKHNWIFFLMASPVIIYFVVFAYFPMSGIILAFKQYNYRDGIFFSPWNGLENFKYLFSSGKAWTVTRNTLIFNAIFMAVTPIFSMGSSILISEISGKTLKKTAQSLMFLPHFVSWVVVGAFMYNLFNYEYGMVNSILKSFGMNPVDIYSKGWLWYFIFPCLNIWKGVGYGSILYLAAITGIDQQIYEAARVDGANSFQKIFKITIPQLVPTYVIIMLLNVGRIFKGNFEEFYNIVGGISTLYNRTDIIETFVFRSLVNDSQVQMAASAAFLQSVLCFVLIVAVNGLVRKYQKDYALF